MNTATAEAKTTTETALTPREAWAVVKEFNISIFGPGRGGGGRFGASWKSGTEGYEWGHGDTPIAAVEDLLGKIGGVSWPNESR